MDGLVLTVRDVTEQHRLRDELEHLAFHDQLTGLGNSLHFAALVEAELAERRRRPGPVGRADRRGLRHLGHREPARAADGRQGPDRARAAARGDRGRRLAARRLDLRRAHRARRPRLPGRRRTRADALPGAVPARRTRHRDGDAEHRRGRGPGGRAGGRGRGDQPGRARAGAGQDGPAPALAGLPAVDARCRPRRRRTARGPGRGGRAGRTGAVLPAVRRPGHRRGGGLRGARPVAASGARGDPAVPFRAAGRGDRPDRAAGPVGPAPRGRRPGASSCADRDRARR